MANRNLLHLSHLEAFKQWLDREGIDHRPTAADYQVLQVRLPGKTAWHAIYQKAAAAEHFTVTAPLLPLVTRFYESRHQIAALAAYELPPWE